MEGKKAPYKFFSILQRKPSSSFSFVDAVCTWVREEGCCEISAISGVLEDMEAMRIGFLDYHRTGDARVKDLTDYYELLRSLKQRIPDNEKSVCIPMNYLHWNIL